MTFQDRYYQTEAKEKFFEFVNSKPGNPCIVIPTGGGKTPVIARICSEVADAGGRVLVLAHRKELLEQSTEKIRMFSPARKIGIYSAGLKKKETKDSIIVAGIQSVYNKAEKLCRHGAINLVIADECFPGETPISTPRGNVNIEDIYIGQPVFTATGTGTVEAISVRSVSALVGMRLNNGEFIHCTPNHPFFTESGWKQAGELERGSRLFSREDVQLLRKRVSTVDQKGRGRKRNQLYEGARLEKAKVLFSILLDDDGESDVQPGIAEQDDGDPDRAGRTTEKALEKGHNQSPECFGSVFGDWMDSGMFSSDNPGTKSGGCPVCVQDRYRDAGLETGDRDRRDLAPIQTAPNRGQDEGPALGSLRVEDIEIIESQSDIPVFNLQIKGHPSYFANGVLVHNCHLIPPGKSGTGMFHTLLGDLRRMNPKVRLVGLTATPYRMTSGHVCDDDNFLNEICYEVSVRDLIANGYLCPLRSKNTLKAKLDLTDVHVRKGEFVVGEVESLQSEEYLKRACREIAMYAKNRNSVLVFCPSVNHMKRTADILSRVQDGAVDTIDGTTLPALRAERIEDFKNGSLKFLVNVDVLTTGFDAPNVDMVVLLRPTLSPGLYYQMVGRGFRIHESKSDCLVLDFGGNIDRHGPVDAIVVKDHKPPFEPNGEPEDREPKPVPTQTCPKCAEVVETYYSNCPNCGWEFDQAKKRHEETASDSAILSGEIVDPEEFEIQDTQFWKHFKKNADPDHPPSLWVSYVAGPATKINEWICFEHPEKTLPRRKAVQWWRSRSAFPVPSTVDEAIDLIKRGAIAETKMVRAVKNGKYYNLIEVLELGPVPELIQGGSCDGCVFKEGAFCSKFDVNIEDGPGCEFYSDF